MTGAIERWGVLWTESSRLDGITRHLIYTPELGLPRLFRSRSKARAWIRKEYGYIRTRPDLRAEPHGWRKPRAVRVLVTWGVAGQP